MSKEKEIDSALFIKALEMIQRKEGIYLTADKEVIKQIRQQYKILEKIKKGI